MNRLDVINTPIPDLVVVKRHQLGDSRGGFSRLFCAEELRVAGWNDPVAQINHTITRKRGTVRGMHFQHSPHAEMKLVMCLRGIIWDVAVDLRVGSPNYLQWHAEELSAVNNRAMLIPQGFAHGFQTLSEDCELLYLHSAAYTPHAEAGLNPKDGMLAISWPIGISEVSAKDSQHAMLDGAFKGVVL
jgi:dTDP-4-dehydrorhamnose 3,5-epimerase